MTTLAEARKAARLALDPYEDWVEREGMPCTKTCGCYLPGPRNETVAAYGVNGAAVHLTGQGDFGNVFLIDIPAGKSTDPQRHLYEEVVYVVEGRGSTQIELPDGRTHSFEWQPRSMFAIPLNAKHRYFNGDGQKRALLASVTSLPLMLKLFHDDSFIFDNSHFFKGRVGKDTYYTGDGDLTLVRRRPEHVGDELRSGPGCDRVDRVERARRRLDEPACSSWPTATCTRTFRRFRPERTRRRIVTVRARTSSRSPARATRCCGVRARKTSSASTGARAGCSRRSTGSSTSTSRRARSRRATWRRSRAATHAIRSPTQTREHVTHG